MINQIRIRTQTFFCFLFPLRTVDAFSRRAGGGRGDGLGWGGISRTLYSSSDLERRGEFLDEDVGDDGGEEDPEAVGEDPVDEERVPVVVPSLAPSAAEVLSIELKK